MAYAVRMYAAAVPMKIFHGRKAFRFLRKLLHSIQAATAATSLQFQTMASALIGGANIFGGAGSVLGTVFGTILLGMIKNGLVQIHASEYWLDFITGAVILLALFVNLIQLRKKGR